MPFNCQTVAVDAKGEKVAGFKSGLPLERLDASSRPLAIAHDRVEIMMNEDYR